MRPEALPLLVIKTIKSVDDVRAIFPQRHFELPRVL
jgi:hypothetical protein